MIDAMMQCMKGQTIKAFRFLSNSIVVVASASPSEPTAILELFRVPVRNGTGRPTPMIKVAALRLPAVDDDRHISHVNFYPPGVRDLVIRERRLLYNASIHKIPFINPKFDTILFAKLNIGGGYPYANNSFIVYHSTLLRHVPPSGSLDNVQAPVPWELWGPAATRWCGGVSAMGRLTCGLRCLLNPGYSMEWELWDFNPYHVRRLGKDFALENESVRLTVETEPSCAKNEGIKNGIYSSLPFVKLVPKKWPQYRGVGLYEDRIIGELVSNYFDPPRGPLFLIFILTLVQQGLGHGSHDGPYLAENLYFG